MLPENMPGFCGPRVKMPKMDEETATTVDVAATSLISQITLNDSNGHDCLEQVPVRFGQFSTSVLAASAAGATCLYNSNLPAAAQQICRFSWAVYGFSGHFPSTIISCALPFDVVLAANVSKEGRALFSVFTGCSQVFQNVKELYNHVRASESFTKLHGYLIHSLLFTPTGVMKDFWQLQLSVIVQLQKLRSLSIVVVFIPVVLDVRPINGFMSGMKKDGWVNIITTLYFPHYGDLVASSIKCLISVHSKTDQNVEPLQLKTPPQINPTALASYIWPRFNTVEYAVSYGKDD